MCHNPPLARLVVVRADQQHSIDAESCSLAGKLDRIGRHIRAGSGDDDGAPVAPISSGNIAADTLHGEADHLELLLACHRRAFPGRSAGDECLDATIELEVDQTGKRVEVD